MVVAIAIAITTIEIMQLLIVLDIHQNVVCELSASI